MKRQVEDILDSCLEKLEQGVSIEEIVRLYPDRTEELRDLLRAAEIFKKTLLPKPNSASLESCLKKVRKEAKELKKAQLQNKKPFLIPFFPRFWVKAAAIVLITVLVPWSTVSLSASSLPGDMLYPVKIAAEKVRYACCFTLKNKAIYRMKLSEKRMEELVQVADNRGDINKDLLESMRDEANFALNQISFIPDKERNPFFARLQNVCTRQANVLGSLKQKVSSGNHEELDNAIKACSCRMQRMNQIIKGEVPQCQWGPGCCIE